MCTTASWEAIRIDRTCAMYVVVSIAKTWVLVGRMAGGHHRVSPLLVCVAVALDAVLWSLCVSAGVPCVPCLVGGVQAWTTLLWA